MKHIWKGHGTDSEIGNVSARQAALNRWTATDRRWKRKAVSRGSVVTSVKRLPICARNSWALALTGPRVSRATGKKSWVQQSELYLFVFLAAAVSAALAPVMALCWSLGGKPYPRCQLSSVNHCNVPCGATSGVPRLLLLLMAAHFKFVFSDNNKQRAQDTVHYFHRRD